MEKSQGTDEQGTGKDNHFPAPSHLKHSQYQVLGVEETI